MTSDPPESSSTQDAVRLTDRQDGLVGAATLIGVVLAVVGLLDGVVMAMRRKEIPCPAGTYFPEGTTDHSCYAHPQAGLGIAIVVFSVLLGILVVFASLAVRASFNASSPTP